jgi:hypothetical protein
MLDQPLDENCDLRLEEIVESADDPFDPRSVGAVIGAINCAGETRN